MCSDEVKHISLQDKIIIDDKRKKNKHKPLRGIVIVKDTEGNIIYTKDNLVVRKGRELILRKLLNIPFVSQTTTQLNNRKICSFGIGIGGTPSNDPLNPLVPTPADSTLNTETYFVVSPLTVPQQAKYLDSRVITVGPSTETRWFKKKFTSDPELVLNAVPNADDPYNDEYYVKVNLAIDPEDCRGSNINEICLFSGIQDINDSSLFTNFQIFSRITFPTEVFQIGSN